MRAFRRWRGAGEGGFTLVEMTVVIAIIAVLAALTLPAVTGVTTSTRESSKIGDLKSVEQAVTRFESDNPDQFPSSVSLLTVATNVQDNNNDGNIAINILDNGETPAVPTGGNPAIDVTCSAATAVAALDQCFAGIQFGDLTPDYLKVAPNYSTNFLTDNLVSSGTIDGSLVGNPHDVDFTVANCDLSGNDCYFYLSESIDLTGLLSVWNVLRTTDSDDQPKVGGVLILSDDAKYGTTP